MWMDCHRGFKNRMKAGNLVIEDIRVNVCDAICDKADLCGIEDCEFYDVTPEGTFRFLKANAHEHTLEGMQEKMTLQAIFDGKI